MNASPVFMMADVRKRRVSAGGRSEFELVLPSFQVFAGDEIAVIGASGSGKSTLVDLLVFATRPSQAGLFEFRTPEDQGIDIGSMWRSGAHDGLAELRKRYFGIVLQTGVLLRFLSVERNIRLARELLDLPDDGSVRQLAKRLGIDHLLDKFPEQLSAGERQRTAIARALAHNPAIIVADEPTASLDEANANVIMSMLNELVTQLGITLIITTHDTALIERYPFRVVELRVRSISSVRTSYPDFRT